MNGRDTLLRAAGITKQYPGTTALGCVDFTLRRGSVHVLIGENGAGKSTLVKILAGVERPTSGRLEMEGRELRIASTRDADAHGIGIIYQELSLFPNLSVVENIFLGRELTRGRLLVDRPAQGRIALDLLQGWNRTSTSTQP
jgi:erythritol transport system ATP-binding protein